MLFADSLFPQPLYDIIYSVFRNRDNIFRFAAFAVAIHVAYVIWAVQLSQKRGYDVKATTWWAAQCFIFGFLGVNMLQDKKDNQA